MAMDNQYLILLLAGYSTRRKEEKKKQFSLLDGKARFLYPLETFLKTGLFSSLVLVVQEEDREEVRRNLALLPKQQRERILLARGGTSRSESVYNGYRAIKEKREPSSYLFIHDGDRPFVSEKLILSLIEKEKEDEAIVPLSPVYDSLLRKEEKVSYVDRKGICRVRTPQVFSSSCRNEIRSDRKDTTDEFQKALTHGFSCGYVKGESLAFKITDRDERGMAERIAFALNQGKR